MTDDPEPWRTAALFPGRRGTDDQWRRYNRALRLSEMARKLAATGHIARYARSAVYWRQCLDHWQDYLDGQIGPPSGRQPQTGE